MKEVFADERRVSVQVLPSLYPQGGEKILIYNTTGRIVPEGELPADIGVLIMNVTSVAFLSKYLETGMPLVEKCLTVDGGAVSEPKNVIAPIGTSVSELLELCGGLSEEPGKIIMGGPMMGVALSTADMPVMKNTNAIVAFTESEAKRKRETACIKCGSCASHCPYGLNPAAFMKAYKTDNIKDLVRLRADLCMECGCCTFICPAGQPLAVTNRLAKTALFEYMKNENKDGGNK
jgi:electron transport complex protein RnfC